MKNKKFILLIIPIILLIIGMVFFKTNKKELKIVKTLENEYYSYLPKEAKEYIKEVYEKTGEIILTEKNKQENTPYLNPKYIEYLQLSESSKEKVEVIPDTYRVEYDYGKLDNVGDTEKLYDLRNVNGSKYITDLKDQGNSGICWAFSTTEQAESYLMVKNKTPYNSNSKVFSPKQIDYATSTDGIKNYTNPHGFRKLSKGGNFLMATEIAAYGLSLINESTMPFDDNYTQKEVADVHSFANSNYEVNQTVMMPSITTRLNLDYEEILDECEENEDIDTLGQCRKYYINLIKNNYISKIKQGIKEYGGVVVSTVTPDGVCGFKNTDGTYAIEELGHCYKADDGHAMQVIGWDDDYTYTYCKKTNSNSSLVNGNCSSGVKTTGKGAFILRNSWGKNTNYDYPYLTYNSIVDSVYSASFYFINNMTPTNTRTWNNVYPEQFNYDANITNSNVLTQTFTKKISGNEKLKKVKFSTLTADGTYSLIIKDGSNNQTYENIINTSFPGLYTIDLSNKNIIIENDTFTIQIVSSDDYAMKNTISVYTSNVGVTQGIKKTGINKLTFDEPTSYSGRIIYNTKGINSGQNLSFSLKKKDGTDISNYLTATNTKIAENNANVSISISTLPRGEYRLIASYGSVKDELPIVVNSSQPDMVQITYYANNGTSASKTQSVEKYKLLILDSNTFTRVGYNFKEWTTNADGTGMKYQNRESILEGIDDNLVLYAQWEKVDPATLKVSYRTHVQSYGWQNYVSNGTMSGTSGEAKRLEAIQIKLENQPYEGSIEYRTHIQKNGWEQYFRKNDEMSGTSGEAKRLEAIEIKLTGEMSIYYDVYYRVHSQKFGWLGWAKNGEAAGTEGYAYRLEGIEIKLVSKDSLVPGYGEVESFKEKKILYTTHVQSYGWQDYAFDGSMSGTSGQKKRLEAIKIKLNKQKYEGDVEYRTHIQKTGWETYFRKNDEISGTSGEAKRLEAIEIKLTGDMSVHYDIYYRVHAEKFGWLNWAKNGESAGTAGYAYRLEGIEIILVNKGEQPPERANKNDERSFISK